MGLFKPEYIDDTTGYRYYTPDQIHLLNTILSFKKLGFTLAEIKTILDHNFNPKIILALLKSKVRTYQKQIGIIRFNIENIDKIIGAIEDCKERQEKINPRPMEQEIAVKMSRISCLEIIKLEDFFSEILWL
jgi:DNA-binding transcriptional MerR regulator